MNQGKQPLGNVKHETNQATPWHHFHIASPTCQGARHSLLPVLVTCRMSVGLNREQLRGAGDECTCRLVWGRHVHSAPSRT